MPMYDKCLPKQRAGLIYGYKLRSIHCLRGNAQNANRNFDVFTDDEMRQIDTIHMNALSRAKAEHDEARRQIETTTTETNQRTASESRQYTGK